MESDNFGAGQIANLAASQAWANTSVDVGAISALRGRLAVVGGILIQETVTKRRNRWLTKFALAIFCRIFPTGPVTQKLPRLYPDLFRRQNPVLSNRAPP